MFVPVLNAIEWPAAGKSTTMNVTCPNCGSSGGKRIILATPWPSNAGVKDWATLLGCPSCTCGFFHPVDLADYGSEPIGADAALSFYLQQGAGLWSITSNLANLNLPPGTRLLEIGCGFGFGLDFARRALGWEVLGLDPSPFAAAGRKLLGLPIESRYFVADDATLGGTFDVVMASEVIEHVPSPLAFAQALRSALRTGGSLVLTTPNVAAVASDTPPGLLVPLLSIGFHLVLQSEGSLTRLLAEAEFEHIEVRRLGLSSLMARCRRGFALDTPAVVQDRCMYRRYLRDAADAAEPDGDLWFGLTARAYREAVGAADPETASSVWTAFSAACRRRYGFDPDLDAQAAHGLAEETLESLCAYQPLCLGPVLLHRAFHRMLTGVIRADLEALFERAAQECERLRRALHRIGTDDGDAEDTAWVARAEKLLCAAERGAADVPEHFAALGIAPGDTPCQRPQEPRRTALYQRRIFVSLVNVGHYADADRVADVVVGVEARAAAPCEILSDDELDVLFCAAVRELQRSPAAPTRALELLAALRTARARAITAGCTGSAVTLATPADNAERLAVEMLGQTQRVEASSMRPSARHGIKKAR